MGQHSEHIAVVLPPNGNEVIHDEKYGWCLEGRVVMKVLLLIYQEEIILNALIYWTVRISF